MTRARWAAANCLLVLDGEQISCLGLHCSIYGDRVVNCRPKSGHARQVDLMCWWEGLEMKSTDQNRKKKTGIQYTGPGKPRMIILGEW